MALSPLDSRTSRNLGFITESEQSILNNSTVAIAGAGGDGGELAIAFARLGIGHIRLADPEAFEEENINRQAACTTETIGVNKARAVGNYIAKINPDIELVILEEGVTADNVDSFLKDVDLLVDETEFTMHALGVMLARRARELNIPNLMALNVGFGAHVTTYHPEGSTLEEALGLNETTSLEEITRAPVDLARWLPDLPPYTNLKMLEEVAKGEKSAPTVVSGVLIAAGIASTQGLLSLIRGQNNRPDPVYSPNVLVFDAITGESKVVSHTLESHAQAMDRIVRLNAEGRVPMSGY